MTKDIIITSGGKKKVNAQIGGIQIKTDQPVAAGGDGAGPDPFSLFLSSIGTCAGVYVFYFCQKRNIPTDNIKIIEKLERRDSGGIGKITLDISLPDDFPEKYRSALIKSAEMCAVKKALENPPSIDVFTTKVSD